MAQSPRQRSEIIVTFLVMATAAIPLLGSGLFVSGRAPVTNDRLVYSSRGDQWQELSYRADTKDFLIHPGATQPTVGHFVLSRARSLEIKGFIRQLSPECQAFPNAGTITMTIKRNGEPLFEKKLDRSTSFVESFSVADSDRIDVTADNAGDATCDWGGLAMTVTKPAFRAATETFLTLCWLIAAVLLAWSPWRRLALYGIATLLSITLAPLLDGALTERMVSSAGLLIIAVLSVFALTARWPRLRYVSAALTVGTLWLPLMIEVGYRLSSGSVMTADQVDVVLQTYVSEAFAYVLEHVGPTIVLGFFAFLALAYATLVATARAPELRDAARPIPIALLSVCLFILGIRGADPLPGTPFLSRAIDFAQEVATWRALRDARRYTPPPVEPKAENDEIYVVVIGESLNRRHMWLYGYLRPTTPELSARKDLLAFRDVVSSHTWTSVAVPFALTSADAEKERFFLDAPSVVEVAKAAGLRTSWWSNQNAMGLWDNTVSILAEDADETQFMDTRIGASVTRSQYDGALIDRVKLALGERRSKSELMVVHLMGNHWAYCDRFPPEEAQYTGLTKKWNFGAAATNAQQIDCYDDSIRYNDRLINQLIDAVGLTKAPAALIYFSDHGEDVLRGRGHDPAQFTPEMAEVPLVIWMSDAYRARYPGKAEQAAKAEWAPASNNDVFHTVLDLAHIRTPIFEASRALTNEAYQVRNRSIVQQRVAYEATETPSTRNSVATMASRGGQARYMAHRCDSLGKIWAATINGIGYEIDVMYKPDAGGWVVGHDSEHMAEATLETMLTAADGFLAQRGRVWLDTKNLSPVTAKKALAELELLDKRFNLKPRAIVESSLTTADLAVFRDAGYHVSYYLPTQDLFAAAEHDPKTPDTLAATLAQRVRTTRVNAVSFDYRAYPYVKGKLEPLLGRDIVYHLWDESLSIDQPAFAAELANRPYTNDERVKTIIVKQPTPFDY